MHTARWCKQQSAGLKRAAMFAIEKHSTALRHDINFIARVWCLRIVAARSIEFDLQTPVLKQGNGARTASVSQPS